MIISLHCSAGHFFYSQNILVLWLHSNPESGYSGLIWSGTHNALLSWCRSGSILQQWETVFPCPMHYLWALNFAWHRIAIVHPSGKCYCLTNLNNCASFGKVAASLHNSLSRSSVRLFLLCTAPLAMRKIDWWLSRHCFLVFRHFCSVRVPGLTV